MSKNWLILFVILILVIGMGGYLGRNKIKTVLNGSPRQVSPNTMQEMPTTSVSLSSDIIYKTKTDATKGMYLTDFKEITLYTFDKDTVGVSNCYATCATAWPAYTSGATTQSTFPPHISVVTRTDGTKQFAWDKKPLYYYVNDTKVGDITGDGVGGVWHIVQP